MKDGCVWLGHWTDEQSAALYAALRRYGKHNIVAVSRAVPGKNVVQVAAKCRWLELQPLLDPISDAALADDDSALDDSVSVDSPAALVEDDVAVHPPALKRKARRMTPAAAGVELGEHLHHDLHGHVKRFLTRIIPLCHGAAISRTNDPDVLDIKPVDVHQALALAVLPVLP